MTHYLSPNGSDTNDGLTESSPKRTWADLARTWADGWTSSRTVLFRRGATFNNDSVVLWGGSPNWPLVLGSYGDGPSALLRSANKPAIEIYGPGGVEIRDLNVQGDGKTLCGGVVWGNLHGQDFPARHIVIERCESSGWGIAGVHITTGGQPIRGLVLRDLHLHHNAVGLKAGHGDPNIRNVFGAVIERVTANENDWPDTPGVDDAGYGLELGGLVDSRISRCVANRNGNFSTTPGHAGIILHYCDNTDVTGCRVESNYDEGYGDGQGICLLGCRWCRLIDDLSVDNWLGGFSLRSEYTVEADGRREWATEHCEIRGCTDLGSIVCLHLHGKVRNCDITLNRFATATRGPDDYRKVLDCSTNPVDETDPSKGQEPGISKVRIYANTLIALGHTVLASFDAAASLRGLPLLLDDEMVNAVQTERELPYVLAGFPDAASMTAMLASVEVLP